MDRAAPLVAPRRITLRLPSARWAARVLWAAALLAGCGGGGGATDFALTIDGPPAFEVTTDTVALSGQGFLPPRSSCSGSCGLLPPPAYGLLGPYTLGWGNAATGASAAVPLAWQCNCGGAPTWAATVPLAPGANAITLTMSAGGITQQATVTVTRR